MIVNSFEEDNYKDYDLEEIDNLIEKKLIEEGQAVYLNIYHLSYINIFIQFLGFGFFHSSIEINGKEFSYSATEDEESGIFSNPIEDSNLVLKEKIYLGNTFYTDDEINEILLLNIPYWLGKSYDPFLKNCNHFTKFFQKQLIEKKNIINDYPDYVNRITNYSVFFNCFYSPLRRLYGNIALSPNSGNNVEYISTRVNNISLKNNLTFTSGDSFHKFETDINLIWNNSFNEKYNSFNKHTNCNNCDISKDNYSEQPYLKKKSIIKNQKCFFESSMKYNFFLNSIFYNGNNSILKKYNNAEQFFSVRKFTQALKIYQEILKEIDLENNNNLDEEFKTIFSLSDYNYILNPKENVKNIVLKLKILHCIFYIFYKNNLINDQELVSSSIFSLNKNDYFALFYKAFIKFYERNIPECVEIIKNGIEICIDNKFKKKFRQFNLLIEQLDF